MAVRKKRVFQGCANPLFVKWVEELRDEAVEKNSKSQYAYSKALSSLKRYPLPLSSGQEAKLLDHIGEKLAKILDKRLCQYKESGSSSSETAGLHKPQSSGKGKKKGRKCVTGGHEEVCAEKGMSPPKSKRRKSAPREYIPVYRSGGYALIIGLHEAEQKPSWCGYLKKDELIAEAQPYSDSSFTVTEPGSYYTAWSTMTKLVERGLIIRYSHPPKFKLSEKGVSLAVRLLQGGASGPDLSQLQAGMVAQTSGHSTPGPSLSSCDGTLQKKEEKKRVEESPQKKFVPSPPSSLGIPDHSPSPSALSTSSAECEDLPQSLLLHSSTQSFTQARKRLEFWYINSEGRQVHSKDEAAVTFNEELSVGFLVKCKRKDLEESIFQFTIENLRPPKGEFIFAYLSNEQGPDYSNPPLTECDSSPNPCPTLSDHTHKALERPHTDRTKAPHPTAMTSCSLKSGIPSAPLLITLSDSDAEDGTDCVKEDASCSQVSDDVEIVRPLSERVGYKRKIPQSSSSGSTTSKKARNSLKDSISLPQVEEDLRCTPQRGGSVGERDSLTPAQKAGMAAVKRMNALRPHSSKDQKTSASSFKTTECALPCHQKASSRRSGKKSTLNDVNPPQAAVSNHQSPHSALVVDLTCSDKPTHQSSPREGKQSFNESITNKRKNSSSASDPILKQQVSNIVRHQEGQSSSATVTGASCSHGGDLLEGVELGSAEFVLRPGDFEVVLCVDSAESTASRKHTSQFRGLLLQELGKNGVQFDVRKLNVGDFLWVGRERVRPVPGQLSLPRSQEVVLEYIVERKRMDDLAGSITDGRFKEQKFRLRSCGVSRPVYLVEEYGDMAHLKLPLRSLNQAIANTQVIDGFYVKRTKDIRESIAYLTVMTRQLQTHYANKTLKAYPHELITELVRTKRRQSCADVVYSMPFNAFNDASIKNKVLTVYEMFGRQLIQLPNFSADKAKAVLEQYPTVSHLRLAYRECKDTGERVKLLSSIKAGKGKRRLGDSLSSLVYSLYWLGKET